MTNAQLSPEVAARLRSALVIALPGLSPLARAVLQSIRSAPAQTLSAGQIRRKLGVPHVVTVNQAMAQAGLAVLGEMDLPANEAIRHFPRPWRVLATEGTAGLVAGFPWQLRPEVLEALEELDNLNLDLNGVQADELAARAPLTEGGRIAATGDTPRRAAGARESCLAAYQPPVCQVCGLDFARTYGPAFVDCLHVHHLHPLSGAASERAVNPAVDLVPVCPNCHAVIHAGGAVRSVEEVRALLKCATGPQAAN